MSKVKSAEQKMDEVRRDLVKQYLTHKEEVFDGYLQDVSSECSSPIEQLMAMALAFAISTEEWFGGGGLENQFWYGVPQTSFDEFKEQKPRGYGIDVRCEVSVGKYRADFVIRYADWRGGYAFAAIECDGHDYHDLTKEQAQHDRERDRYFQDVGLVILRYPGSEIWKNPLKCAADALGILSRRAEDKNAKRWD